MLDAIHHSAAAEAHAEELVPWIVTGTEMQDRCISFHVHDMRFACVGRQLRPGRQRS